jgi:hypothetical protein
MVEIGWVELSENEEIGGRRWKCVIHLMFVRPEKLYLTNNKQNEMVRGQLLF